jgi:hypothetical protein
MIRSNQELPPLPDADAIVAAVRELHEERPYQTTAQVIAHRLGVRPARRSGRGAVAGSWSGYMAPALRIAPRLRSLARAGRITSMYDHREYARNRLVYVPAREETHG